MKTILFALVALLIVVSVPANAQLYPGSQITIVSSTTLQDSLNVMVHTKDSVGNAAGASYTTQKQRVIDSVAQALYRTNLLALKVAKADSGTTLPGYATKTEHNTKVAKADSGTTYPGYVTKSESHGQQIWRSLGTIQTYWEDTDAADDKQPFWYWESANNGSKGIFYLGYANRTGSTTYGATDRILVDSVSVTLGTATGTGTVAFYAGATTISSLAGTSLTGKFTPSDSTKGLLVKSADGIKWLLRVSNAGVVSADSTGQN